MAVLLLSVTVVLMLISGISAQSNARTVVTTKGTIIGFRKDLGNDPSQTYYGQADVFIGVPYAAPPVGPLRFARTQEVPVWTTPINASTEAVWPPQCPQGGSFPSNPKPQRNDEDCLYMNIYSPNIDTTTLYPVMFFIHGGAFASGNVGTYEIDGVIRNLVSRGVVVVIIQYRLNVLGFFTTNTTDFPANLGLLDQVEALKFVQNNIGFFGGDRLQVTIFGQSAGACSVSAHTYSPLSVGLFKQAIMESGTALLCFDGSFEYGYWSQSVALQFCKFGAAQWNAGDFTSLKACMQNTPWADFLNYADDHGPIPWPITVDGYFMPDFPRNLAAKRPASYSNMPIMLGTNLDEWGFYELEQVVNGKPFESYDSAYSQLEMSVFMRMYGENQSLVSNIISSVYIDPLNLNDSQHLEWMKVISRWHTDGAFDAVTCREVDLWLDVNNNPNVHLYRYSYRSHIISLIGVFENYTGWDPVGHGEELLFVFMMPAFWSGAGANPTADDFTVANWWGKTWTDFAKTGNVTQSANWPALSRQNRYQFMEILPTPIVKPDYGHNARNVFNHVIPKVGFLTPQIPPPIPEPPFPPIIPSTPGSRTVVTSKGTVIGFNRYLGDDTSQVFFGNADVFLGVPYARPPVGEFRFARTQDVPAWSTPVNASVWPPHCPQHNGFPSNVYGQINSEDCLYMNIFSPNINPTTLYPVMFYIHGGGFNGGDVGTYEIDGVIRNLVSRGVVVVIIQYRLAVLGFFTTNTTEFPANLGLLDQVQALKFVQNEIAAFGGDRNQVTIFGQSAGACSVSAHTYSPLSVGLFKQALMESGQALLCFDGTFEYGYWSQRAAQQFCNFTSAMWNSGTNWGLLKNCMQNMDYNTFLSINQDHGPLPWVMIVDGYFMPDFPRNLAAKRPLSYINMPVLMGTNRDEWGYYELEQIAFGNMQLTDYNSTLSASEMAYFMRMYGDNQPLVSNVVSSVYIDPLQLNDSQNTEWLKAISAWHTEGAFEAGACREIDLWRNVNNNTNVYLYRNSYRSTIISLIGVFYNYTGWDPVGHGEEVLFVFMMPQFWRNNPGVTKDDLFIADWFGKMWTDFAKTGDLRQSGWHPTTINDGWSYYEIVANNPGMRPVYGHNARNVFNQVMPKITFITPQIPPPWNDDDGLSTTPAPTSPPTTPMPGPRTVTTSKGVVIGRNIFLGNNMSEIFYGSADVFMGVPYAAPPVGNLRFARTQEVPAWSTPINATLWPPQCPQRGGFPPSSIYQPNSEDCLYMNIFSPNINTATLYPVMFFIHGGAFSNGNVGTYNIDGVIRNLVSRGVVVVIIQYRVNVLGFFTTNTTEFPANLGLLDQVEALRFVQNNIAAFGGDKDQVTIFGQSAGACSVSAHTYSPLSVGLFKQAIMESGQALLCFDGTYEYGYWSQRVAQQFCNFTSAMWNSGTNWGLLKNCMQNMDFNNFLNLNQDHGPLPWVMSIDGYFMPDFPRNLAAKRPLSYVNMPVLMGTNHDEWGFYELEQLATNELELTDYNSTLSAAEMAYFMRMYGVNQPLVSNVINSVYIDPLNLNDSQHTEWLKIISRWHTDGAFEAGACREIDLWRNINGNKNVYLYRNSYRSRIISLLTVFEDYTGWDPVGHGEELLFVFMMPNFWRNSPDVTADDLFIANWFGKTWTDFAKTGNVTQSAGWTPTTINDGWSYFEIVPDNPGMRPVYGHNARNVFNQVMPKLTFLTPQIPPPWDDGTTPQEPSSTTTSSTAAPPPATTPLASTTTPTTMTSTSAMAASSSSSSSVPATTSVPTTSAPITTDAPPGGNSADHLVQSMFAVLISALFAIYLSR